MTTSIDFDKPNLAFRAMNARAEPFEVAAQHLRAPERERNLIVAFVNYRLIEPFRDEFIARMRHNLERFPLPPAYDGPAMPKVFGFVANPVISYNRVVQQTARLPLAWRFTIDGSRWDPDRLKYILDPASPHYYDSPSNAIENHVKAPEAIRLVDKVRAENWHPSAARQHREHVLLP